MKKVSLQVNNKRTFLKMKHLITTIFLVLSSLVLDAQVVLPTSISGLDLWLSADSVLLNTGKVSDWYDKSTNGITASQADANKYDPLIRIVKSTWKMVTDHHKQYGQSEVIIMSGSSVGLLN